MFNYYYERYSNYNVQIIRNINDISNNSIVFMGDTVNCPGIVSLLHSIAPDAIYIGWYWHNIKTTTLKYFIYTYENMKKPDSRATFLMEQIHNCPLLLRASEHPDLVGTHTKNIMYDYCYMGWGVLHGSNTFRIISWNLSWRV